jgi:hypothetical protein
MTTTFSKNCKEDEYWFYIVGALHGIYIKLCKLFRVLPELIFQIGDTYLNHY